MSRASQVFPGRFTASMGRDQIVVFLIGMRVNQPWNLRRTVPVFAAMPRMIRELAQQRDLGLLGYHVWFGRTILLLQYWESFDKLDAYARAAEHEHLPAWRDFNRRVGSSGKVGFWHETYLVAADRTEAVYGNMPRFGLAAATGHVPATGSRRTARTRMGMADYDAADLPATD